MRRVAWRRSPDGCSKICFLGPGACRNYFYSVHPHVGVEMPNDHLMLMISTKAFAEKTGVVVGFPMTHSVQHADNPFAISAPGAKCEVGYVLTHQPK